MLQLSPNQNQCKEEEMNFEYLVLKSLLTIVKTLVKGLRQATHPDDLDFLYELGKEVENRKENK